MTLGFFEFYDANGVKRRHACDIAVDGTITLISQSTISLPNPLPVSFPSAQSVVFPSAQPVTFPSAQNVNIASSTALSVTFPSAQNVQGTWTTRLDRMGDYGDAASSTGSIMAQLRYLGDSLNRQTSITAISESASGDRTIISATTGKSIRISSLYFILQGAANVTLKAGATSISGAMSITEHAADYPQPLPLPTNTAFIINLSAAVTMTGYVIWYLV